jgi:hypothetical protein
MMHPCAPRIKTLQRREMLAETERLAKVCHNIQTDISDRLEVQQSCSEGFPLATRLVFSTITNKVKHRV